MSYQKIDCYFAFSQAVRDVFILFRDKIGDVLHGSLEFKGKTDRRFGVRALHARRSAQRIDALEAAAEGLDVMAEVERFGDEFVSDDRGQIL